MDIETFDNKLYRAVAVYLDYDDNPVVHVTTENNKPRDCKAKLTRWINEQRIVRPPYDRTKMSYEEWYNIPPKPFRLVTRFVEQTTGWERANV